jgi:membrane-bound lytic murein transglycosylase D
VAYLRDLNDLPKGRRLKIGQTIYVPDRTPLKDRSLRTARTVTRPVSAQAVSGGASSTSAGGGKFHVVQSGDSLYTIARRYNTTIDQLSRLNKLSRGKILKIGMKLRLPGSGGDLDRNKSDSKSAAQPGRSGSGPARNRIHIVKRGENLISISQIYNVAVTDIRKRNRIRNPSAVMAGAKLIIPAADSQD